MTNKFIVKGLVQGIGFRPFVAKLADELNIDGWVRNTGGIVTILASGEEPSVNLLLSRIKSEVPTGGFITDIQVETVEAHTAYSGFTIIESDRDEQANLPLIPADIATCDNCKKELFDITNRRYLHPFISCTICGPRYSIIESLPYDRETITMSDFQMCNECKKEYTGKLDIRRYAQTIACKNCGPKLEFKAIGDYAGKVAKNNVHRMFTGEFFENLKEQAPRLFEAIELINNGGILALKDIGGYHLACTPFDYHVVESLRNLKHREAKAFAVMFEDVEQIMEYCFFNEQERKLLESPARPIVLLKAKKDVQNPLADNVCLNSPNIGAMLPCNPLQMIMLKALGPLIMTSANASGDVLETNDESMIQWMEERALLNENLQLPLGVLSHDRRILRPMDDSVMKVVCGRQQFIRRARGFVPNPIPVEVTEEIFAAGGDLKSTFCYVKNGLAYVSQHFGDMESVSCQSFYKNEKLAMERIFGFEPDNVVVDKHPGYFSKSENNVYAIQNNIPIYEIQHHKAHVASVIAEHNIKGKVLGFAFDGTGYGDDGTIWGSETFLFNEAGKSKRVAHLTPVKLIGGDEGAKNCDTVLTGYLHHYGLDSYDSNPNDNIICAALDNNINSVVSTSMGRLFDAVSALLDICHYNSYEGQAPIELENLAATASEDYKLKIAIDGDCRGLFKDIVNAIEKGVDKSTLARGFIYAVADYIVEVAKKNNVKQIVLSGGTFLNTILLEKTISMLEEAGFEVYIGQQLPPGDGGICLGQAYLASRGVCL